MHVSLAIHTPRPEKADELAASMHRFRAAMRGRRGLVSCHVLRDRTTGRLLGLALWETEGARQEARPALAAAIKNDPFPEWEDADPDVFHLDEVGY